MRARPLPPPDIAPEQFFARWIPEMVRNDPERSARLGNTNVVLEFQLEGEGGGSYQLEVRDGLVHGSVGSPAKPDLRLKLDLATWRRLNSGELSAPEAFVRQRVKLEGNFALALKLHLIIG